MGTFKDLRIWQQGIDLASNIYQITRREAFRKDFGLRDQIQRASVSISSNIAEGEERDSSRAAVYYLKIAKGSCAEVITQLHIAYRIGYINEQELKDLENDAQRIIASIRKLIRSKGGNNPLKQFSWLLLGLIFPF